MLSGCATIFTGTKDRINFNSEPSGALVYVNGIEQCRTPCSVNVTRSVNDTDVEFRLDGYETRIITLNKEFNLVSIVNLTNPLGWGIDVISGAVMKYDQQSYDIVLNKKSVAGIHPYRINIDTDNNIVELFVMEN